MKALVLAAGKGSRMLPLTASIAKPALEIGNETLISRLVRQLDSSKEISKIYVNCSHQPLSIVRALSSIISRSSIGFLWEEKPLGPAWTLLKLASKVHDDILCLHGDLFLDDKWTEELALVSTETLARSYVFSHKRSISKARSIIHSTGKSVNSIQQIKNNLGSLDANIDVWSNAGIYILRQQHLAGLDISKAFGLDVVEGILNPISKSDQLELLPFHSPRFSVETEEDLEALRALIREQSS